MNKLLNKLTPEWALRAGLGAMYVYSGIDIIRHPTSWFWAVRPMLKLLPASMRASLGASEVMIKYLIFQGIGELVLAFLILGWFLPRYLVKWAALVSILEFAVILILIPIDAITFRDIGLLGAFIALWLVLRGDFKNTTEPVASKTFLASQVGGKSEVETFDEFMGNKK